MFEPPKIRPVCSVIRWEVRSHHCSIGGIDQQSFNRPCAGFFIEKARKDNIGNVDYIIVKEGDLGRSKHTLNTLTLSNPIHPNTYSTTVLRLWGVILITGYFESEFWTDLSCLCWTPRYLRVLAPSSEFTERSSSQVKGRVASPKVMNFWKSSKRPLIPPPHFRKILLQFFPEFITEILFLMAKIRNNFFLDWKLPSKETYENT